MEAKQFEYNESVVEFELDNKNVMVNATQMAKVFGKKVNEFMTNDSTIRFIQACLKNGKSRFLNIEKEEDLYTSRQKSGTWMHRVLALKFAAWLNPDFELWVFTTIDELLFGSYIEDETSLKKIAKIQSEITQKEKTLKDNPILKEIADLKTKEQKEKRKYELRKKSRISNFKQLFSAEEMEGEKGEP